MGTGTLRHLVSRHSRGGRRYDVLITLVAFHGPGAHPVLAYFMGLFNHNLYLGTPPSQEEARCAHWMAAEFVRGGLAVNPGPPDPFEEEKGKFNLNRRRTLF